MLALVAIAGQAGEPRRKGDWEVAEDALEDMRTWLMADETLTKPMQEVELEVATRGRELMRRVLQAHLNARDRGDVGPAIQVVEQSNVTILSHRREADRDLYTVFGEVDVPRLAYAYPGQQSLCPADEVLNLPKRNYSYEMQRHLVREAVKTPYGEAIETVHQFTGVQVSKRTCEDLVKDSAVDFEGFYQQRILPKPRDTASIVVGSVDCKGVCMLQESPQQDLPGAPVERRTGVKRMATVATVYTVAPRPRTAESVVESLFKESSRPRAVDAPEVEQPESRAEHKRVWASLKKSKDDVINDVAEEIELRDPDTNKTRMAITDGEVALQKRVKALLPGILLVLDLLHVLGKLWEAAGALYGDSKATGQLRADWVRKQVLRILRGGVSEVVRGIRQSVTKRGLKGKPQEEALSAAAYLFKNRRYMRYQDYLAQGLPIASGAIEGACKNLIKDRMEGAGMRWREDTAEPMIQMRAVYLSGHYNEYWAYHIAQEQKRLRANRTWSTELTVDKK